MACGAQQQMVDRYGASIEEVKKHARATSPLTALQFALTFFGVFATVALTFWYGTLIFTKSRLDDVGVIIVVLMNLTTIFFSMDRVSAPMQAMGKASLAACEFFSLIDAPKPERGSLRGPRVSATDDIIFDSVTFAYPSRPDVKILDELDLRVEAGKITTIVGPSGSGKSTIVGLIERWYSLTQHVTTCGHSLDEIDVKWWRSQIGLVQQEPFLFNDTIYENVARGLIRSRWEEEPEEVKRGLVKKACQEAFANEFIDKLPQGYDTKVATSAIDVRGERIVQEALNKVAQGRTTIIIAHRLSTIKNADRIVVLKKGKVVESGTHESLISMDGVYAGLVNAQALSSEGSSEEDIYDGFDTEDIDTLSREKSHAVSEYSDHPKSDKHEGAKNRGFFGSFGRFFFESKTYWGLMIFSFIASMAAGTVQPLYAWMFSRSIDLFKYQDDHSKLMDKVDFMGIMWTVFAASAAITYYLTFISSGRVASFIRAKYQTQYFSSLIFQSAAYFDEDGRSHGTLVSRVRDDPLKLEEMMGTNIAQVCIAVFNLSLVSMAAVTPVCVFSGYLWFRYELQFEKMNDEVFAESSQFASEAINAFRTVSSLTLEDSISARFEKLCLGHVSSAFKKARWVSIILGFSDSATLGCQALIFYYGGRLLTQGEIGVMGFFVCLMAMMNAAEGFGQSLSFGPNAAQAAAASNRILDARESLLIEPLGKGDIPDTEGGITIELRDVRLRYAGRKTPVLNGLNMTIEKGQFVALVGASGCGKTSIISLLERFYQPEKGQILCNGKDISDVNIYTYRKHLSLVAQEPTLFQDNILLGIDPSTITNDQLHSACRDASIRDFIASLPEGYNTNIGSRGVSLSGGQKQRVSIARALIRNPQILLLDEATSSLDSQSERIVQAAFERAAKGRTMIAVAHRLATVQNADVIYVFSEGGHVLEKGSHGQLLKKRGVYFQMVRLASMTGRMMN
ncbi:P-loop containing nucleoside triphosphate hydrolase protein [Fusarium solani]|uniref:P-loop containing nucleoside triphosphate hydrolase protein n=1 Tax=Fusarium solani TaxID=169388 RepID=A0A9P9RAJ4_FUSSL|nr:P-loop containing nucleoside triphosphate hydrolase protein [Fusarium solani]KAH7271030.1 P-loop containing nucleoside triphosphate hydrolase protein [Fusarium solani]